MRLHPAIRATTIRVALVSLVAGSLWIAHSQQTASDSKPYVLSENEGETLLDSQGRTNIIKVSPRTGARNLAMGTQDLPPGTKINVHRHDRTEEILYLAKGAGVLILGEERIEVEAGSTVWVPPGAWHGVENPSSDMRVLWFVTPPGLDSAFRAMFWGPGEEPKQLTPGELEEIGRRHDNVNKENRDETLALDHLAGRRVDNFLPKPTRDNFARRPDSQGDYRPGGCGSPKLRNRLD